MEEKRTNLEIIAPTVEEAVERGLSELGVPASAVDVEVLDSGSKGLFGLGLRQARVRLSIKEELEAMEIASPAPQPVSPRHEQQIEPQVARDSRVAEEEPVVQSKTEEADNQALDDSLLQVARDTVQELLDKMKIRARLDVSWGTPDDPKDRVPLMVDIRGDDLSILIGPKSETLNALQYISALIIGKEVGYSVPLVVDVEGYRLRRSQQIRQLARRMADQAVRTGKRQLLEPMPANERRLVHIELRDHPDVTTESIGEEPRRKVTINPK